MRNFSLIGFLLLLFHTKSYFAQNNVGLSSFQTSQLGFQSALIGMGGYASAYKETQSAFYLYNPAFLDSTSKGKLSLGYTRYIGRTNATELGYSVGKKGKLQYAFGFKYLGYGKNESYDVDGNSTGTWSAADFSFRGLASYVVDSSFKVGASIQQAVVQLPQNSLTATLLDVGFYYKEPNATWSAALLLKGMGKVYGIDQKSPFDIQLGLTKKPKNAPFRFLLTLYGLQKWDVLTEDQKSLDESIDPISGEVVKEKRWIWGDNAMRHVHTAMEWQFGQMRLFTGYNYERRKSLQIESAPGLVGMSMGIGFTTKRWECNYSWSNFNPSNVVHSFGIVFQPFSYH